MTTSGAYENWIVTGIEGARRAIALVATTVKMAMAARLAETNYDAMKALQASLRELAKADDGLRRARQTLGAGLGEPGSLAKFVNEADDAKS